MNLAQGFFGSDFAFFVLNFKSTLRTRTNSKSIVSNLSRREGKPQAQSEVIRMPPGPAPHFVDASPLSKCVFK